MSNDLKLIAAAMVVAAAGWLYYCYSRPVQTVNPMAQEQAEHAGNVQQAAEASGIGIDDGQSKEAAEKIKWIHDNNAEPEAIEYASGDNWQEVSESAREKAKADYAIVTADDGTEPTEIKQAAEVKLNQYNVQAYKKAIRTIEYDPINKQADFVVQRKVSDNGQYLGVGAGYDFDDKKAIVKIVYSW